MGSWKPMVNGFATMHYLGDASSFWCTLFCPGVPACQVPGADGLAKSSFSASAVFPRELTAPHSGDPERDLRVPHQDRGVEGIECVMVGPDRRRAL
jgi:hypothetical protein